MNTTLSLRCAIASLLFVTIAGIAVAADTSSTPSGQHPETSIPFANHGGIRDWQVLDDSSLLVQGNNGRWYLAKLQSPAFYLPFTERLGFATDPSGTLEKFSAVIVRGQRYPIVSLTRTDPPIKTKK